MLRRAAGVTQQHTSVALSPHHPTQFHSHVWSALLEQPCSSSSSNLPILNAAAVLQQPLPAAAAPLQPRQRHDSLRCYSSAQQAGSSEAPASGGPRKLKYNLRQLTKGDNCCCSC